VVSTQSTTRYRGRVFFFFFFFFVFKIVLELIVCDRENVLMLN
jgi:hypothetical protein